ncbi:hypothetical protein ACIA98_43325, partial [Streptomyces sp. NPDC051366]
SAATSSGGTKTPATTTYAKSSPGQTLPDAALARDSENGGHIDDPSEDDPVWFAAVTALDQGGDEIVRREHEITIETNIDRIESGRPAEVPRRAQRVNWMPRVGVPTSLGDQPRGPVRSRAGPLSLLRKGRCP